MRSGYMAIYGEKYFRELCNNWVDAYENYFKKCKGKICHCITEITKRKSTPVQILSCIIMCCYLPNKSLL